MNETGPLEAVADGAALPRTRGRRAPFVVLGVLLVLGAAWLLTRGRGTAAAPGGRGGRGGSAPAVPVAVAIAEKRDLPVYLSGLGTVTAFNTVAVKSRVDGQIMDIPFKEGQEVHKGDLLLVVDPRPFELALEQAEANLARDVARLADERRNLQRNDDLFKEGILPQQQYDAQVSLVHQIEAATRADQAQIDNAKLQLAYCRITAPVNGRVGLRQVDVGNVIRSADQTSLLVITQVEPMAVVFSLPEDNLQTVARRMRGETLSVEAWSRDDRTKLATGALLTIDNQIDTTTGTVRLKAQFDNKDRVLWPNQFVNARLLVETRKAQTMVPAGAVQRGSQGVFAYVVNADKKIEVRPLKVGLTQAGFTAIDDGVAAGEQVVTDGHEKVQAGSVVEVRTGSGRPAGAGAAASAP